MYSLPAHLRARISALGELSRPLGEARATVLARELASSVAMNVKAGRNPEPAIDGWIERIVREIAATRQKEAARVETGTRVRPVKDLLPEIG